MSVTHALVINLAGSDTRLSLIADDLDTAHFTWARIDAVNGRDMDVMTLPNYDAAQCDIRHDRQMSGGEVGCFLSHVKALQHIVDDNLPHALVLEDDMTVPADLAPLIASVLDYLDRYDPNWHCVHLDATVKGYQIPLQDFGDMTLSHSFFVPCKAGAILWSNQGARSYLNSRFAKTIMGPVDREMRSHLARTGRGYMVLPYPAKPRGLPSDIDAGGNRWAANAKSVASSPRSKIRRHFPDYFFAWVNLWKTRVKRVVVK